VYNYIVIKIFLVKYKRVFLIILAMVFLVVLFLVKNTTFFKKTEVGQEINPKNGLISSNATIEDLINRDTDKDGVPDWQEGLWGTDPTKKETTPGVPDSVAIDKLRIQQKNGVETISGGIESIENLTQTEKFSRELFTTVATLSQSGQLDQATIDALGNSLAEKIQNSIPEKIYILFDLNIIESNTKQTIQKYSDTFDNIFIKKHIGKGVPAILQEFITNEENISILLELNPIIDEANQIINELVKMPTPRSLSLLHLNLINSFQRIMENISDIKLFDSDTIVAMGAIVQYEKNALDLSYSANKLTDAIKQKLNN